MNITREQYEDAQTQAQIDAQEEYEDQLAETRAYWKEKEGRCLACGTAIAIEDQYCPADVAFLNEVHQQGEL